MDDLIYRSTLLEELSKGTIITDDLYGMGIMAGNDHAMKKIKETPAVDAVEVIRCMDCKLWDREHIEMHPHSTEHPEQQAEFAECQSWSTWSTCFMTRSDDYCSQAERRDGDEG